MTALLALRVAKVFFAALMASALGGAVILERPHQRMALVHRVAAPSLVASWTLGWLLMKLMGRELEPWTMAAAVLSVLGLHCALGHAQRADAPRWLAAGSLAGLCATMALMAVGGRAGDAGSLVGAAAGGLVVGGATGWVLSSRGAERTPAAEMSTNDDVDDDGPWRYFRAVAWAEGISLVVLFFVFMPLKYGAHLEIDGGTGVIGWVHGTLLLVYLSALWRAFRGLSWSWISLVVGFVASLLPGGTFVLERRWAARTR